MARGWESKSVEEQQAEKASERAVRPKLDPAEQARRREAEALKLQISRLDSQIAATSNERYREQLTAARAEIESKLRTLDPSK